MATSFKTFIQGDDIGNTRNLLHEAIPITGTIVSGTYTEGGTLRLGYETNIKNYSHGMFQSVYDYPYLSSSANQIFDLSIGVSANSGYLTASSAMTGAKSDIYNELCQMVCGYDVTGSLLELDCSGNFTPRATYVEGGTMRQVFIINFARLLSKDEIQPASGSFIADFSVISSSLADPMAKKVRIFDKDGTAGIKNNSPAGDYNILYCTASQNAGGASAKINLAPQPAGLIFYQAGIAVITSSIFQQSFNGVQPAPGVGANGNCMMTRPVNRAVTAMFSQTNISGACNALRNRIFDISFNNTTELNSTIYFCRANRTEFNFSSNPTYLNNSTIRVRNENVENPPVSYITTVGLYGQDNELLAVGKLSEPLKKTPSDEFTLRVRLDY